MYKFGKQTLRPLKKCEQRTRQVIRQNYKQVIYFVNGEYDKMSMLVGLNH